MPDFEVFSVSSQADPDDGEMIIVFDGKYGNTSASFQIKMEGVSAKLTDTPGQDVLAFNAAVGNRPLSKIQGSQPIAVSEDGKIAKWTINTQDGQSVTFVMTEDVVDELLRLLEVANGPPKQLH